MSAPAVKALTILALAALVVGQGWLMRRRQRWVGLIIPLIGAAGGLYLAAVGSTRSVDGLFVTLGALALLAWRRSFSAAREKRP